MQIHADQSAADVHPQAARISHIEPHKGWSLYSFDMLDGDGFWRPEYFAACKTAGMVLPVSRFNFEPTQARFNWLVDNVVLGKGTRGVGPLTNADIDCPDQSLPAKVARAFLGAGAVLAGLAQL
jgi:hypothetical protein